MAGLSGTPVPPGCLLPSKMPLSLKIIKKASGDPEASFILIDY